MGRHRLAVAVPSLRGQVELTAEGDVGLSIGYNQLYQDKDYTHVRGVGNRVLNVVPTQCSETLLMIRYPS